MSQHCLGAWGENNMPYGQRLVGSIHQWSWLCTASAFATVKGTGGMPKQALPTDAAVLICLCWSTLLQAASFHEALPLKALDQLSFQMFKAEVLSAVRGKTKVLAEDGFTILVVESCSPAANTWPLGPDGSSSSGNGEDSSDEDAAVWYGDQQATAGHYGTSRSGSGAAAGPSSAGNTILGVIEVGVQDEADVLQHLPRGLETYAYISSMAVASHVRRCGIGAALLQAAEQQAKLWGQDLLALHVYETNGRAMKLYESHGLANHAADPAWRRFVGGKVRQLMVKWL
jgi:ribosomal protein S18 acetylase RimI-like enzyme